MAEGSLAEGPREPFALLTAAQAALLAEERHLLGDLRELLAGLEATAEDLAMLRRVALDLDELFLLVVVGEFNAGKSAFINALLGERVLPEGVTPTTTAVNVMRYGAAPQVEQRGGDLVERTYPHDLLREVRIVDTPGTNAVIQRHQEITERFVPRSDLVLFVTSTDRPFTESERAFLERIRQWGKKVVLVLNKVDLLEEAELAQVVAFVEEHAQRLLGFVPEIFPVSARRAQQARQLPPGAERQQLWAASRFGRLENYIYATLEEESRFKLKLLSPLGVAERLAGRYQEAADGRLVLLRADLEVVESVDAQIGLYAEDTRRDFRFHLTQVENIIHEMTQRGRRFFDDTVRLTRVFDLINTERIRGEFERTVVANTSARIEAAVQEIIDWLVEREHRAWSGVEERLRQRVVAHEERLLGRVGDTFAANRRQLLESVGRAARRAVESYDPATEARELALSVRSAVAQTALVEVGAVSLGTVVTVAISTLAADVTGIIAASVLALVGFYVIPTRRRQAQAAFEGKMRDLQSRLLSALGTQFERELEASALRLREAVAPYTRFVRAERAKVEQARTDLAAARERLLELRQRLG